MRAHADDGRPTVVMFTGFPPPVTGQALVSEQVARWAAGVAEVVPIDTTATARVRGGAARRAFRLVRQWGALRRVLRARPDVLYLVLSSSRAGRARDVATVALAGRRAGRVVGHVHVGDFSASLDRPGDRQASRWLMRRVDTVVVLSERLAREMRPWAGDVRVVPNTAPDVGATAAELVRKRAGRAAAADLRVVLVANDLPGKGHRALLAGLAAYQARRPARPAQADVVGAWRSPGARSAFEAEARRLGLVVRVHGAVADRERVRRLVLAADVVALPSRYRHEALPLCLIEGLATGTPVVGTDHGAIADLVTPETGVLLADDRPETLADALAALAGREVWAAKSAGAQSAFETRYAPDLVRARLLDALGLP